MITVMIRTRGGSDGRWLGRRSVERHGWEGRGLADFRVSECLMVSQLVSHQFMFSLCYEAQRGVNMTGKERRMTRQENEL